MPQKITFVLGDDLYKLKNIQTITIKLKRSVSSLKIINSMIKDGIQNNSTLKVEDS